MKKRLKKGVHAEIRRGRRFMIKYECEKKDITEFDPTLIHELKNPSPNSNYWDLADEYGCDEVLDAMAVIAKEKNPQFNIQYEVMNYVWDYYLQMMTEAYCDEMGSNQFYAEIS